MKTIFTQQEKTQIRRLTALSVITGLLMFLLAGKASAQNSDSSGLKSPSALSRYSGVYNSGFVQLNWSISKEEDISHFDIERCTDGVNFRQIGQVSVSNNTNLNYTFLDILAEKGSNFYRLAIIDKDGNFTYSQAITISVEVKGISVTVVYPNPFSRRVHVKINCDNPEQISINVINNAGTVVRTQAASVAKGDNNITITNVDDLPPGIYYLEVIGKDRRVRIKLMKQQ